MTLQRSLLAFVVGVVVTLAWITLGAEWLAAHCTEAPSPDLATVRQLSCARAAQLEDAVAWPLLLLVLLCFVDVMCRLNRRAAALPAEVHDGAAGRV